MEELVITWQGLLFEALAFLVFTYLFNLFLLKPVKKIFAQRADIIQGYNESALKFEQLSKEISEETEISKNILKDEIKNIKKIRREEALSETTRLMEDAENSGSVAYNGIISSFQAGKKGLADFYESQTPIVARLIHKKITD